MSREIRRALLHAMHRQREHYSISYTSYVFFSPMRLSIWHDGGLSDVEGDEDAGECSSSLCFLPTEVEIEAARRDLEEASAADMRQRRDTPDVRDVILSPTIAEIPQKYPETTDI